MRLALSNDEWFFVEQDNIKLVELDGDIHIVGGSILYGVSESGTRYRLNPDVSTVYLEEYTTETQIVDSEYDAENDVYSPVYSDVPVWELTELTLDSNYGIPNSMKANDIFNFDNFGISYIFMIFLSIFIAFRIFSR